MNQGDQEMLILLVLIVVGLYAHQKGLLKPYIEKLKTLMQGAGAAAGGAAGGGASSATGTNVYQVVAPISPTGDTRISGDSSSHRDNQGFPCDKCARESTWIFTPGKGGDWSIKMGSHGSGGDNGSLIELSNIPTDSGGGGWECEGPHNSYHDLSGGSTSMPAVAGKAKIGVKGISWPAGSGMHHEIWLDETGAGNNWKKVATYEGAASGCNAIKCPVPSGGGGAHCQDTLRIDNNSGHKFISRSIVEIKPGVSAGGGGGTTTETPTESEPAKSSFAYGWIPLVPRVSI